MNKVRLLLFTPKTGEFSEVQCADLPDYYKYLECDTFDIVTRNVCGKWFDIFCDDEGLLKDNPVVSALTNDFQPALVGNLIFAHHDDEGNTTGLSDDDIVHIRMLAQRVVGFREAGPEVSYVVYPVDYTA